MRANVYIGKEKGTTVRHMHFQSLKELDEAELPTDHCRSVLRNSIHSQRDRVSWWGMPGGWMAVKDAVAHGWPDGVKKAQDALKELKSSIPRAKTQRRVKVRGPQGNELDIHRVYAGDLQRAWRGTEKQERFPSKRQGKKVTVAVELGISAMQDASILFWRGAVAMFMADILTRQGYSVQILGVLSVNGLDSNEYRAKHVITVELKPFGSKLNLDSTMACTGLAGFLRGHMFKAICCFDVKVSGGLGSPARLTDWIPPQIANHTNHMIYVQSVRDLSSAKQFILAESAKLLSQEVVSKRGVRR